LTIFTLRPKTCGPYRQDYDLSMARVGLVAKGSLILCCLSTIVATISLFWGAPLGTRKNQDGEMPPTESPLDTHSLQSAPDSNPRPSLRPDSGLVHGLPPAMGPFEILAEETVATEAGGRQRRRVVATSCDLGNLLTLEELDRPQPASIRVYSADHVVVVPDNPSDTAAILSKLLGLGLNARAPFPQSPLIYLEPETKTPGGIFAALDRAGRALASEGFASLDPLGSGGAGPTDPNYTWQWHHRKISAPQAWEVTTGNPADIIAILDTGLHAGLVEFAGRVVPGTNVVHGNTNTADDHFPLVESNVAGHGTIIAAVLAANANNSALGAGMNWSSKIMPIKVLNSNNTGFYSHWAAGIDFARQKGAKVINLSAGGTDTNNTAMITTAIDAAIQAGAVFVTISGNDGATNLWFPGSYSNAITVGATTTNDTRWPGSNRGPIDLVAPGDQIFPLFRVTNATSYALGWVAGTSYAAPLVAGAASLLLAVNPSLDHYSARALLIAGAEDGVGGADDILGYDTSHGWGRLNIWNSLLLARTAPKSSKTTTSDLQLSWTTPTNAAIKKPYTVSKTGSLGAPWTNVAGSAVSISGTNATWIDPDSANVVQRFYRLNIGQ